MSNKTEVSKTTKVQKIIFIVLVSMTVLMGAFSALVGDGSGSDDYHASQDSPF